MISECSCNKFPANNYTFLVVISPCLETAVSNSCHKYHCPLLRERTVERRPTRLPKHRVLIGKLIFLYSLQQRRNFSAMYSPCVPKGNGIAGIVISLLALPFHILVAKVLVKDTGLTLPHHLIMLSLTISDALYICSVASMAPIVMALRVTSDSFHCRLLLDFGAFITSLTIVVSSLVTITLAVERMIICIHFLNYRRLFRRSKIKMALRSYWSVGVIIAVIAAYTYDAQVGSAVTESTFFQIIVTLIVLPSAFIITVIYIRICLFSREKMIRIRPNTDSSNGTYTIAFRRKQIRIEVVAGIVCVAYIGCMVPLAAVLFLELTGLINTRLYDKRIVFGLAILNNLADPLIYGFGMTQTRQTLARMLKNICPIWH